MSLLITNKLRLFSFLIYSTIGLIYSGITFSIFKPQYLAIGLVAATVAFLAWIWLMDQKQKFLKHISTLPTLHPPNAFLFGYQVPAPVWNQWLRRNLMVNALFLLVIFLVGTPLAAFTLQLPDRLLAQNTDARAALYSSAFVVASVQMGLGFALGLLATTINYFYQKKALPQVVFFQNGIRIGYQIYLFDLIKYPLLQLNINALKVPAQLEVWVAKRNSSTNKIVAAAPSTTQAEYYVGLWNNSLVGK